MNSEINKALFDAAHDGNIEEIKRLLDEGADINARDKDNNTILHWAISNDQLEAVKELLDRGIDIELRENGGFTALHFAARLRNVEIVKELLNRGADIHAKTNAGKTALYFASRFRASRLVKELLERGAELDLLTLSNHPKDVLEVKSKTSVDVWSDILFFIIKEQPKYKKEDFKKYLLEFLNKIRTEIPENIYIIINTLI